MSAHTPGPWVACLGLFEVTNGGQRPILAGADSHIAYVTSQIPRPRDTRYNAPDDVRDANARLIAAAPDMLAELEHLVRLLQPLEQSGELQVPGLATLNGARAAIAQARGKT